ncbi:MAG: NAD(P)H-dependent oxidoreductase [bacterium]|nr:NAD(P)H-dependent oxidoreductase [bacterium]
MSKVLIINASPRKQGTSTMLCRRIHKKLGGDIKELFDAKTDLQDIIDAVNQAEAIVIAGPCYVNSYPARVTLLLETLQKQPGNCHGQKLYGIINGGMPYVHTHESGLHQLELFAEQCPMHYAGGFVIGIGPMLNGQELEKHMCAKKIVPAFETFTEHIRRQEDSPATLYYDAAMKMPALIAKVMTRKMSNNITKQLASHGFDYNTPSPYYE